MSARAVPVLIAFRSDDARDGGHDLIGGNALSGGNASGSGKTNETVPSVAHPGDAGLDLRAASATTLAPGQRATIGTGVSLALPHGFAAYVLPRSGLAARHGITVLNAPGTIDAGYRGEIAVTLLNTDTTHEFSIATGDRIAQMVLHPVHTPVFTRVERLPGSARGAGGHGSTGGFGATSIHQHKD